MASFVAIPSGLYCPCDYGICSHVHDYNLHVFTFVCFVFRELPVKNCVLF